MKVFSSDKIRNIGLVSHATVGKTTLAESMLYVTGAISRIGLIDEGATISDYHPDEIERKFSISTSLMHVILDDCKLNIIDTPGYLDFKGEVKGAMSVCETAVVLLNAVAGVEVGTEQVTKAADDSENAKIFFINKCDKEHASFNKTVQSLQESYDKHAVPVQLAVNPGEAFNQIIDLVDMKLLTYADDGKPAVSEIPSDLQETASTAREVLVETIAESDDALLEKYFEDGDLSGDDLKIGLKSGILKNAIYPVLCGSAVQAIGIDELNKFVVKYCPAPNEKGAIIGKHPDSNEEIAIERRDDKHFSAQVFKTMAEQHLGEMSYFRVFSGKLDAGSEVYNASRQNSEKIGQIYVMNGKQRTEVPVMVAGDIGAAVKLKDTHTGNTLCTKQDLLLLPDIKFPVPVIRAAVEGRSSGDDDKIGLGLHALHEEDPSFLVTLDPELHQTIISGQGELHLDILMKRLTEKFHVEVDLVEPKIPYRETIRGKSEGQHKYKKQSGGRGQYGDVHLRLEAVPRGKGFEFVNEIVGGVVPSKFIPAVEKGVREALASGVIAGCQVEDVRVSLYDGSYHNVDSSDMAFKIAASMGFKKLFRESRPVLMEPVFEVEVRVPEEYMGDVMGDLSSRRGKIIGMDVDKSFQLIKAHVPLAELYKYSTKLRSLTQGRGIHRRKFDHYSDVPKDIQDKIVEEYEKAKEQGH